MARKRYSDEDCLKLLREIELHLAAGSDVAAAYRRKEALEKRRDLMEAWSDFVGAELGSNILKLARNKLQPRMKN